MERKRAAEERQRFEEEKAKVRQVQVPIGDSLLTRS